MIAHQGDRDLAAFKQEYHPKRATRPKFVGLVTEFAEPQSCMLVRVPESERELLQTIRDRSLFFSRELFVRGYERFF